MEVERTKDGRQGENQNSLPHLFAPVCQRMRALTAMEAEEYIIIISRAARMRCVSGNVTYHKSAN